MFGGHMATITGTAGNDSLTGTSADDIIDGAGGIDTIFAGAGDDIVRIIQPAVAGDKGFSLIDGGAGFDILDVSGLPAEGMNGEYLVAAYLADGTPQLIQWGDQLVPYHLGHITGFEEIQLGPNAVFYVSPWDWMPLHLQAMPGWRVVGGGTRDFIGDGWGSDTINSADGDDQVQYHGGNDQVSLGQGNDEYDVVARWSYAEHVTLDGGAGADFLSIGIDAAHDGANVDLLKGIAQIGNLSIALTSIEHVSIDDTSSLEHDPGSSVWFAGTQGNDNLESFYGAGRAILLGRDGNDTVDGGAFGTSIGQGSVTAYGGPGDDSVRGGDGDDWLMGGGHYAGDTVPATTADDGFDTIWGWGGNDHIWGNSQFGPAGVVDGNDMIDAGPGADYVNGNAGNDNIYGGAGSDRLYGGAGNDWIQGDAAIFPGLDGSGPTGAGNDHINGNKGDDVISGGGGNDELLGGQGNDVLYGDEGNDQLEGGQGNDFLYGSAGLDTLTGGDGRDTFVIDELAAGTFNGLPFMPDLVTDFRVGEDLVEIVEFVNVVLHPGSASDYSSAWTLAKSVLPAVAHSIFQVLEDAAAVQVGPDTYLFWDNFGNGPEAGLRLANTNALAVRDDSFYHFSV